MKTPSRKRKKIELEAQETSDFARACAEGRLDDAKALLGASDPSANGSEALRLAARNGHEKVVRFLIPLCDPSAHGSQAYFDAMREGHAGVAEMLRSVSELPPVKGSFID